ncbi:unnamed protein product [Coffea canephora]|uniref:Uncharacterized protein n=1 Tax=Coffea canephora TaxID=49390 RepID=A0A068TYS1_COFCA|nr:unnamed protein product [Coffea canephora]
MAMQQVKDIYLLNLHFQEYMAFWILMLTRYWPPLSTRLVHSTSSSHRLSWMSLRIPLSWLQPLHGTIPPYVHFMKPFKRMNYLFSR